MQLKCTIIGAGNVATHLAAALARHFIIRCVYSRSSDHAAELASKVGAQPVDTFADIDTDSDLYIISLPDDAIPEAVAATSHITSGIWVHTSGATPMTVFCGRKEAYGVFYPLQTFTKARPIDFADVPMLIEGSDDATTATLRDVASAISRNVRVADSAVRLKLHVAAVFACNFVNYMWTTADEFLRDANLDLSLLHPIMRETLAKIEALPPRMAQTGPARRGDIATINRHLDQLSGDSRELYDFISKRIYHLYNEQD